MPFIASYPLRHNGANQAGPGNAEGHQGGAGLCGEGGDMNPENALVYRRIFPLNKEEVMLEERWDLSHPDCPFIHNPWASEDIDPLKNVLLCRVLMTQKESDHYDIPLK